MAEIEYRITVDSDGNAIVTQDVLSIDANDRIRFTSNISGAAIQFDEDSPFDAVAPGRAFPVMGTNTVPLAVKKPNASTPRRFIPGFQEERKAFHFQCGQVDSEGHFFRWEGPGGFTPLGGLRAGTAGAAGKSLRKDVSHKKSK